MAPHILIGIVHDVVSVVGIVNELHGETVQLVVVFAEDAIEVFSLVHFLCR